MANISESNLEKQHNEQKTFMEQRSQVKFQLLLYKAFVEYFNIQYC